MRRPTPAACQTAWAKGQTKNRCWQSSSALAYSGHSSGASGTIRCNRDLVIKHRHNRSLANTLIFRGIRRFHTKRHLYRMNGSSESCWFWNSLYATRVVKLWPLHTHASCAASDRRRSARSACRLISSATPWLGNASGRGGTQASFQVCRTNTPGSVDSA